MLYDGLSALALSWLGGFEFYVLLELHSAFWHGFRALGRSRVSIVFT